MLNLIQAFGNWLQLYLIQNYNNYLIFLLIICLVGGLSVGIGFFVLYYCHSCKRFFFWEVILFSLIIGFNILCLLFYIAALLHISAIWFMLLCIVTIGAYIFFKNKKEHLVWEWKKEYICLVLIFLLLFNYYAIPPLTTKYGFARDYDLTALGIQQTGDFVLPPYSIESYYPPLVSTVGAYFTDLVIIILPSNPSINPNRIMVSLFSLAMVFMFISAYFLGYIWGGKRSTGILSVITLGFIASSRNAVIGGSTYPAILANLYFFCFLIFLLLLFNNQQYRYASIAGIFLAGIFLSHLDIFFSLLWFLVAGIIIFLIWYHQKKRIFFHFFAVGLIAILLVLPYLWYGLENKGKFDALWTGEKWLQKVYGEAHPKSLSETMFFVGKPAIFLVIIGLLFSCINIWKREKLQISFLFLVWFVCILLQNSWEMLRIARLVIHIYPLNIIMWTGLIVFITCIGTYGFQHLFSLCNERKMFLGVLIICTFFIVIDYETINMLNVFRPGAGFLWQAIAEKNTVISSGDEELLLKVRQQKENDTFLVPDTYAGYYFIVATGKNSTLSFYEGESYHDPTYESFFEDLINKTILFFNNPNSKESMDFLKEKNISYIYISAEQGTNENNDNPLYYSSSMYNGNYEVLLRANGAKLLRRTMSNSSLMHIEAEFIHNNSKLYFYPKSIYRISVPLHKNQKIVFPFANNTCFSKGYLFAITSPFPLKIIITAGNETVPIIKQSAKIQFSEISFKFNNIVCGNVSIKLTDTIYSTEIDWLELE